ncbi:MAG: hypothetical protein FWD79_11240 [Desulfobulbus sp.]|nr:hypothetical protein [Desulfobulbus sp.]
MSYEKFIDLSDEQRMEVVRSRFRYRQGSGWFTPEGVFAGASEADVIAALIDLEEAEINAIGDCMGGCAMIAPRLENFVRRR